MHIISKVFLVLHRKLGNCLQYFYFDCNKCMLRMLYLIRISLFCSRKYLSIYLTMKIIRFIDEHITWHRIWLRNKMFS